MRAGGRGGPPRTSAVRTHICEYGVGPPSVTPVQAGIHATAQRTRGERGLRVVPAMFPRRVAVRSMRLSTRIRSQTAIAMCSDRMDSCLRRNDGRLGMAQVVEMVGRADFGVDGDRSPPPAPTELILNTVALSLISPRKAGGDAEACPCAGRGQRGAAANISVRTHICEYGAGPPPSFPRRQESMRPPNNPWRLGTLDVPPMYRRRALGDQAPSDDRSPCDALRSHGFLPAQE